MMASDAPSMRDTQAASHAIGALAHELVTELEGNPGPAQSLLMRGARLARMAGVDRMEQWLDCELRGYDPDDPDTDKFMRLSRRWKDEEARVGYFEPLPALESRAASLEDRDRHLRQESAPAVSSNADERLAAIHTALLEHAASRSERARGRILSQLGDIAGIRSSVFALLHAFADRMAQDASQPASAGAGPPPISPDDHAPEQSAAMPDAPNAPEGPEAANAGGLTDEEVAMLAEADRDAATEGNEDLLDALDQAEAWAAHDEIVETGEDADADALPEAMLTDDAALDDLASMMGDSLIEVAGNESVEDGIVEDWDAPIDEGPADLDSMSADQLVSMLESALESSSVTPEESAGEDDAPARRDTTDEGGSAPPGAAGGDEDGMPLPGHGEPHAVEAEPSPDAAAGLPSSLDADPVAPGDPAETPSEEEEPGEMAGEAALREAALRDALEIQADAGPTLTGIPEDSDEDPFAPLVSELMRLRDDMEEADAQEAAEAAVACSDAVGRFAALLGGDPGGDPQEAMLAVIDARVSDAAMAASLKERAGGLFAQLIEVEIGGDALVMKRACVEAARLMNDLLNP